jgi:NADPH:quinone reductase-like Zn-dependent oxidoreductase
VVEAIGVNVGGLHPGDEVYGYCDGAFAEFALSRPDRLAPKPARLSFAQAAALPVAGTTALRAVRAVAGVRAGHRLLVNGAAGGVGGFAVQIAAADGAEVTGVCGPHNTDLVRDLGAAHVIDYTTADFTDGTARYDTILDNVGNRPPSRVRRALTPTGTLILNAGGEPGHVFGAIGHTLRAALAYAFARQHLRILPTRRDAAELLALNRLVGDGLLTPVISRTYTLADTADGLRSIEEGHTRGKAVIAIRGGVPDDATGGAH